MYKPSFCKCRSYTGLTAESQRNVSDVAESGRLLWWGIPEDNLATRVRKVQNSGGSEGDKK